MKSVRFIFILLLIVELLLNHKPGFSQSKVFIPDANFRSFLNAGFPTFMDLSGDSLITDSASAFAGNFDCSNQNIADLTGIEYFTNIYRLECNSNQLTSLPDLSAITTLLRLYCHDNQLTSLPDFSLNASLLDIYCENNQMASLPDLSDNTALLHLICNNNLLTELPDLSANIDLLYLHVDNNQLTSLPDLSNNTELCELSCNNNQLKCLPDLAANTNLYDLACNGNSLPLLPDLSANTALKYIYCHSNSLKSLPDLSNCTSLVTLVCDNNQLTSLPDLSANTNLHIIYCSYNLLSGLPDLSGNNALQVFHCSNNKLDFSDARELRIADTLSALYNFSYEPQLPFGEECSMCIYEGDSAVLNIPAQDSALSYQWFKDNEEITGATDTILVIPEIAYADTGAYTCKSYGNAMESPPMNWGPGISEFVSSPVAVKIKLPCTFSGLDTVYYVDDDTVILTGSPPGGIFSGPGISGNCFIPHMAGSGIHTITYYYANTNGCISSYSQQLEILDFESIQSSGLFNGVILYPNPSKGMFSIEMNIAGGGNAELQIFNALGTAVISEVPTDYSGHYISNFNLSGYSAGIYYLQIIADKKKIVRKIIIE
jgi:Leucine-rich repeat (LRR) protein